MRCFRNPETIHAICEDYRAGASVDLEMDDADFKAGRKVTCPVLLLWGATGGVGRNHKSMEIWPRYASDIRAGKALPSGHYVNEEAPEETYPELRAFFRDGDLEIAQIEGSSRPSRPCRSFVKSRHAGRPA